MRSRASRSVVAFHFILDEVLYCYDYRSIAQFFCNTEAERKNIKDHTVPVGQRRSTVSSFTGPFSRRWSHNGKCWTFLFNVFFSIFGWILLSHRMRSSSSLPCADPLCLEGTIIHKVYITNSSSCFLFFLAIFFMVTFLSITEESFGKVAHYVLRKKTD